MMKVASVSPHNHPHIKAEPLQQELIEPSNQLLKHELFTQPKLGQRFPSHVSERVVMPPPQRATFSSEPQLLGTLPQVASPMQAQFTVPWQPSMVPSPLSVFPYSPVAYGAPAFTFPSFPYAYSMPSPVYGFATPNGTILSSPHAAMYPGSVPMVSVSPSGPISPVYLSSPSAPFAVSPRSSLPLPSSAAEAAALARRSSISASSSNEKISVKRTATAAEVMQESVPIRPVKTRRSPSSRERLSEEALDPEMPTSSLHLSRKESSASEVEAAEALSALPIARTIVTVSPDSGKNSPIQTVPITVPQAIRPAAIRPTAIRPFPSAHPSLADKSPSSNSTSSSVTLGSPVKRSCAAGCGASFRDANDMVNHEKVCARVSSKRRDVSFGRPDVPATHLGLLRCSIAECTFTFESPADLQSHEKQFHDPLKLYVCSHCNRRFGEQTALRRHVRTHTGERPFVCKFKCGRTFSDATNAKRHEIIHTGTKPFVCLQPGCLRQFARRGSLKNHMVSLHYLHPRSLEVRHALSEGSKRCREIAEKLGKARNPLPAVQEARSGNRLDAEEDSQGSGKDSDVAENRSISEEEEE